MRVLIAAGGTGGHFYPGLAVAKALAARGDEIRFVVRHGDYVIPLLKRDGLSYRTIYAAGFRRSLHPRNVLAVLKLLAGTMESVFILLAYRPSVLLVMGGYLSVPPALAAKMFRIPVILHEQNVRPGMANRLLGRLVTSIAVSFEASLRCFPGRPVVTGNPVRDEFRRLPAPPDARRFLGLDPEKATVLVFGGSLGAHRLNRLMVSALAEAPELASRVQLAHFTGAADETEIREAYRATRFRHQVTAYCHDMPAAYGAADVVICRSGASTISELMAVKKPAILVPYPLATENHQRANADLLADAGVARVVEEKDLSPRTIASILRDVAERSEGFNAMRENFGRLGADPFRSVGNIVDLVDAAVSSRNNPSAR